MSKVTPGTAGVLLGKTGDVVISRWRGILVGKRSPRASTKAPSESALEIRARLAVVGSHISNFSEAIAMGFKTDKGKKTAMNLAMSYHLRNAVTGQYPNYALDYSKIVISDPVIKRTIDDGGEVTVIAEPQGKIKVSWLTGDYGNPSSLPSDRPYAVFHDPSSGYSFIQGFKGSVRSTLTQTYNISTRFAGNKIHGYLFFVSANGKLSSLTHYLPPITLLD